MKAYPPGEPGSERRWLAGTDVLPRATDDPRAGVGAWAHASNGAPACDCPSGQYGAAAGQLRLMNSASGLQGPIGRRRRLPPPKLRRR